MTNFQSEGRIGKVVAQWVLSTPNDSTKPKSTLCSISNKSITPVAMAEADPWFWDIDRVVRELCTPQRSWPPKSASQMMPDPMALEENLREQGIDGSTLLSDITETVLREELGIKKRGEISTMKHAILELRSMSHQYNLWLSKHGSDRGQYSQLVPTTANSSTKRNLSPDPFHPVLKETPQLSPELLISSSNKRLKLYHGDEVQTGAFGESRSMRSPDTTAAELSRPPVSDSPLVDGADLLPIIEEPSGASVNVKKRKRIAPTLITTELDVNRDREIPTEADAVRLHDPRNIEPGIIYIGDDGKKRMVPLSTTVLGQDELARRHQERLQTSGDALQKGGKNGLEVAESIIQAAEFNKAKDCPDDFASGYLGKRRLPVDKIFYGSPINGSKVLSDEQDEWMQVAGDNISNGRRLYVHKLMKHFLNVKPSYVSRKGKIFSTVIPYPTNLIPTHQSPSLTVFHTTENGHIFATQDALHRWPEVNPDLPKTKISVPHYDEERRANFHLPDSEILGGPSSYDNWDPSLLEKYKYIEGGDIILPLYGDSDEEGEYDIDTWREIEEEHGTLEKPLYPVKRRILNPEEVSEAINEGIAQMVVQWNKEKLPKRQAKAWKLWKKSRRDKSKRRQIREFQQHVDRINNERLVKMKQEIMTEIWTSSKQVRKQSRIMEQSIFDREDLVWQISVLESKIEPERPTRSTNGPKLEKAVHDELDDGESIETETEADTSEDDMTGFVIDDDESYSTSEALRLAEDLAVSEKAIEGEDEDATTSPVVDTSSDEDRSETPSKAPRGFLKTAQPLPKVTSESDKNSTENCNVPLDNEIDFQANMSSHAATPSTSQGNKLKQSDSNTKVPNLSFQRSTISHPEVIDLTALLTSDASAAESPLTQAMPMNLITPEKPTMKLVLKTKRDVTPSTFITHSSRGTVIDLSDSDETQVPLNLPPLTERTAIAKYALQVWQKLGDRTRFMIAVLMKMHSEPRDNFRDLFSNITVPQMWQNMLDVITAYLANTKKVRGMDDTTFKTYSGIIRLFEMYVDCQYRARRVQGVLPSVEQKIKESFNLFASFYEICHQTLIDNGTSEISYQATNSDDEDSEPLTAVRRKSRAVNTSASASETEALERLTPHKVRKRKVFENAQAREQREQDQERLREQDERRRVLRYKLEQSGENNNTDQIIINESKFEEQGFIYVNENIAKRIKPHQVDGIRFLWNQIVSSDGKQGCLLAHTMGLGKTMQTITLLVAIAEAQQSVDESIRSQIPKNLSQSRTLVLCPPGLIDNWLDELLTWAPKGILGDLRKVDSSIKYVESRLNIIESWYRSGGVLVMGYEMFRNFIHNPGTAKRNPQLSSEKHEKVTQHLLEGPSIVIADEAHKMKNVTAAIATAAIQIKTRSRIALTGSPLANNVEEYHTMIDWVAPNYLGPIVEFRAKYVEPIETGLWNDSSAHERRKGLKMLGVLKEDLTPKVHRADMSVLRNELMPKTEFVITVPLTDIQSKAYSLYVRSMLSNPENNSLIQAGQLQQTTLWHWLAILSLLCNHPESFRTKLTERNEDAKKDTAKRSIDQTTQTSDDEPLVGKTPVWKVGVSQDLIKKAMELFDSFDSDLSAFSNSNKIMVLLQILDASKAAGDKVLIFSQSIITLDFLENLCKRTNRKYARLDGSTTMSERQGLTKQFNTGRTELYLISTAAGGLGLNLPGANRVIIFDFKFNPTMEEQAIGRAYRIGQQKPVFVYRFVVGGTFEEIIHNKAVFKMQLASRVVDKKAPVAWAKKNIGDFLFEPKEVKQHDLSSFRGMDPLVLDRILDHQAEHSSIRAIVITDTFNRPDEDVLTADEQREVEQLLSDEKLKRANPGAYHNLLLKRSQEAYERQRKDAVEKQRQQVMENNRQQPAAPFPASTAQAAKRTQENVRLPESSLAQAYLANNSAPFQHAPPYGSQSAKTYENRLEQLPSPVRKEPTTPAFLAPFVPSQTPIVPSAPVSSTKVQKKVAKRAPPLVPILGASTKEAIPGGIGGEDDIL